MIYYWVHRPQFVTSFVEEQKVDYILVEGGSAINIMPKSMMHNLGITIKEFPKIWTMIQGFNLEVQRAIGMILVKLVMGDLSAPSIFHVVDAKNSYKLLLGKPWLHE